MALQFRSSFIKHFPAVFQSPCSQCQLPCRRVSTEYSAMSHQLTDARVRLRPAPAVDEPLAALNKKIADLELQVDDLEQQLKVLREQRLRVRFASQKTFMDQWYASDAGKEQILRERQGLINQFQEANLRKTQAAAAAECESWCWQGSSASGFGDRWWAASTRTPGGCSRSK